MPATIELPDGKTATCDAYSWESTNLSLAVKLNAMLDDEGPSGSDPNPDYTAALAAVEKYGGKVTEFTKLPYDPETVY